MGASFLSHSEANLLDQTIFLHQTNTLAYFAEATVAVIKGFVALPQVSSSLLPNSKYQTRPEILGLKNTLALFAGAPMMMKICFVALAQVSLSSLPNSKYYARPNIFGLKKKHSGLFYWSNNDDENRLCCTGASFIMFTS